MSFNLRDFYFSKFIYGILQSDLVPFGDIDYDYDTIIVWLILTILGFLSFFISYLQVQDNFLKIKWLKRDSTLHSISKSISRLMSSIREVDKTKT